MSAFNNNNDVPPGVATPQDVIAYLRGQASPGQIHRIRTAADNPDSPLYNWLRVIEVWAQTAFPSVRDVRTHQVVRPTESMDKLEAVIKFVDVKFRQNILTVDDVARVYTAGGLDNLEQFPRTPVDAIAATVRMLNVITERHPKLAAEIADLKATRVR